MPPCHPQSIGDGFESRPVRKNPHPLVGIFCLWHIMFIFCKAKLIKVFIKGTPGSH